MYFVNFAFGQVLIEDNIMAQFTVWVGLEQIILHFSTFLVCFECLVVCIQNVFVCDVDGVNDSPIPTVTMHSKMRFAILRVAVGPFRFRTALQSSCLLGATFGGTRCEFRRYRLRVSEF